MDSSSSNRLTWESFFSEGSVVHVVIQPNNMRMSFPRQKMGTVLAMTREVLQMHRNSKVTDNEIRDFYEVSTFDPNNKELTIQKKR